MHRGFGVCLEGVLISSTRGDEDALLFKSHMNDIRTANICRAPSFATPMTIFDTGEVSIGTTGLYGGSSVGSSQYLGVRFQAIADYHVVEIGGHFGGTTNTTIFGAVVQLTGASDFPELNNLASDPGLIGYSVFGVPQPSGVVWGSLNIPIHASEWYALVFGSGIFGASGYGFAPYQDVSVNTGANSFWFTTSTGFIGEPMPHSTLGYFGLRGSPLQIPEPPTVFIFSLGMVALLFFVPQRARNA